MKADKTFAQRLPPSDHPDAPDAVIRSEGDSPHRERLGLIVRRAVGSYLVLVFGLGALMSLLGLDPLARGGLMPKALLVFVGLALLLAVINTLVSYAQEREGSWLRLLWELSRRQK